MSDLDIIDALEEVAADKAPPLFWSMLRRESEAGVPLEEMGDIVGEILSDVMAYALAPEGVEKHLGGKHDQKSHGRGGGSSGGGSASGWGDRQRDIDVAARRGPSAEALQAGMNAGYGEDEDTIRQTIVEQYGEQIEEDARYYAEESLAADGITPDDPGYETELESRIDSERDNVTQSYVDNYGEDVRDQMRTDSGLDVETFDEVYGVQHTGVNIDGEEVTLYAGVTDVQASYDGVDVYGEVNDANGGWAGEFHRRFFVDDNGDPAVYHELLQLDESAQGTGFAKTFNKAAEDYYISHGVTKVYVHAALDGGGYAWAKQGFDWQDGGPTASVTDRLSRVISEPGMPRSVVDQGNGILDRFVNLDQGHPDYPTPSEVAMVGYVPGAPTWPGKEAMRGADWFGVKHLTPSGPRTTAAERAALTAANAGPSYQAPTPWNAPGQGEAWGGAQPPFSSDQVPGQGAFDLGQPTG